VISHRRDPAVIDGWEDRCEAFTWTETAHEVL
jgi:hypothetical protein